MNNWRLENIFLGFLKNRKKFALRQILPVLTGNGARKQDCLWCETVEGDSKFFNPETLRASCYSLPFWPYRLHAWLWCSASSISSFRLCQNLGNIYLDWLMKWQQFVQVSESFLSSLFWREGFFCFSLPCSGCIYFAIRCQTTSIVVQSTNFLILFFKKSR